ncbi:MAG: winged helix-turn-helix domain-containing protein [Candidatus Bathyarchaeota archaeon]|nr:winged helix-turn-helix domain-containing protein [Candidatus Bathyarchaeota archaeon]
MDFEDVFCSKLRMKILKIISNVGELNVSEIARRIGANYGTTNKHLEILEGEGILLHKMFGRIRLYRLNERSPKTKAIQNLIDVWEHANKK